MSWLFFSLEQPRLPGMTLAAAARGRAERDQHSVLAESVEPVTDALPGRRRRLNVIAKSSSAVLVT
ncbi:MAG: hypothetical protein WCD63_13955, partial [Terrimicrobiaceae bacterium]